MPQQGPLTWYDGEGWLVLCSQFSERWVTHVLSLVNLDRPLVVLLGDGTLTEAEALVERFADLGGPPGEAFALSAMTRDQLARPDFLTLLSEAGLLYLASGDPLPLVRNLYRTPALERIARGYATFQGLTLMGVGGGAVALGAWLAGPPPTFEPLPGIGFLPNAMIATDFAGAQAAPALRTAIQHRPGLLGLGIAADAALACGPQGQVQAWGEVTAVVNAGSGEVE